MEYARLADDFARLEAVSGRLEMTSILVEILAKVRKGEMGMVVRLLQGAVAPDWEGLELGLAEKQILKVLASVAGAKADALDDVTLTYQELGDLGLAAQRILERPASKRQASLFGATPLTVRSVYDTLVGIAKTGGSGSQAEKQRLLAKLLLEASPLEARFITRTVAGRLRLGVADMTFLDALAAWHLGRGVRSVQDMEPAERAEQEELRSLLEHAYDLRSDLAVVAAALQEGGPAAVGKLGIVPGVPVRPMAAEREKTFGAILERMQGDVALEYKYDGLRMQAHVPADPRQPVRLFSRRLEEITAQFPDVAANLRHHLHGRDCIVEGEAVALDEEGKLRPFQDVARRRGRKTDMAAAVADIPVTLFLFDCLADGGEDVMGLAYAERRARLARMLGETRKGPHPLRLSASQTVHDEKGMEAFFEQALDDGAEGMMCKDPRAPYKAGSRGYAWIKFKADYDAALADTMDLVCIGAFHGRGRRAGWYGALLMAARDEGSGTFQSVCKLGTGFSDEMLASLKDKFAKLVQPTQPKSVESGLEPDVWFNPEIVMEVQAAELTLSPTHRAGWGLLKPDAGLAARFPRFTKWREDKGPDQATTVDELVKMYRLRKA